MRAPAQWIVSLGDLLVWAALFFAFVGSAATTSATPFAYVPNMMDDTVSVIDTATNTVVDTVAVGRYPMAAAVHPDGSRVYVVESYLNHVSVINAATNTVVARVEVQEDPRGLAVHPDGSRVYVAGNWNGKLSILSTATNTVVGEVVLGWMDGPWEVAFHPDGSRLYVSNGSTWNNTVSVVDTTTNTLITQVPTGVGGNGIAVHPDGTRVYIANSGSTTISVLGTATNTILDTVTLPSCGPQGVAVHPDGTRVYVACAANYTLVVIDAATNTVVTSVPIVGFGVDPTSVAVHPDGTRVYVINKGADTVSVVDTGSNAVVDTIPVGDQPYSYGIFIGPLPGPTPVMLSVNKAGTGKGRVTSEPSGIDCGILCNASFDAGTVVTLSATPAVGSTFGGWSGEGCSGTGTCQVTMTVARTVTATFLGHAQSVGTFRPSFGFFLDYNANGVWDGCGTDRCLPIGLPGDMAVVGDWNGSGTSKVGAFRPADGTFYLDYNGNGQWDGCATDRCLQIGMLNDIPLVGDWTGSGTSKVGTFRPSDGTFYLDYNGNGQWDGCAVDRCLLIGMLNDIPLVGDWNGSGTSKVGAFRPAEGMVYLDYNGNGVWDGCSVDHCMQFGQDGDIPVVGDWNGSGTSKVGAFRPNAWTVYLDYDGDSFWDGCGIDRCLQIGMVGDIPLVGDWNGSGTAKVGAFRPSDGFFYLDYNGSGTWDGCGIDRCLSIGLDGDTPLVGAW